MVLTRSYLVNCMLDAYLLDESMSQVYYYTCIKNKQASLTTSYQSVFKAIQEMYPNVAMYFKLK